MGLDPSERKMGFSLDNGLEFSVFLEAMCQILSYCTEQMDQQRELSRSCIDSVKDETFE